MMKSTKAILVVSFGTSYAATREKTIDAIENDIAQAFPEYRVYRAWTSRIIMAKILKRDGIKILNVPEAMQQMLDDGITEVIVQPTHIINGIENDRMKEDVNTFADRFEKISFGTPLLTTTEDMSDAIDAVLSEFPEEKDEDTGIVFMGHGTPHYANAVYAALGYMLRSRGFVHAFLGTVEGYPEFEHVMADVKASGVKKLILAPFMIVAGDHATNDLSGDEEDSWKSMFENAGYEVSCRLKGLGEYPKIREMLIAHIRNIME